MLQWLIDRASMVYAWFVGEFWTWLDRLKNFWSYVTNKVIEYYNSLKNTVSSWITDTWNYTSSKAVEIYNTIRTWIENKANDIRAWVQPIINDARSYAYSLWFDLRNWIYTIINDYKYIIADKVNWLKSIIDNNLNHTNSQIGDLDAKIGRISIPPVINNTNWINTITSLVDSYYLKISDFFKDPSGYILSGIWSRVIEFLSFSIAYGLGTTKNDLPPIPKWYQGASGGEIPIPSNRVVKPCKPLWISGYTFNNPAGHMGTDFGISGGQSIFSAHDGTVIESGWSNVGYGNYIVVKSDMWWTRYAHLQTILVSNGQSVYAGQEIGKGDTTGNSTGNHLHFEIKYNGTFVDPVSVIES